MKFGFRKPSIKKSIKARTTGKIKRKAKKTINPFYGKKGMGFIKNPKKSLYNKIYNKTSFGVNNVIRGITKNKNLKSKKSNSKINETKYCTDKDSKYYGYPNELKNMCEHEEKYKDYWDKYQDYTEKINSLYSLFMNSNFNTKYFEDLKTYCEKIINIEPIINKSIEEENKINNSNKSLHSYCIGYHKLAMAYEKLGRYDIAIEICKYAIESGFPDDNTKGGFEGRIRRLEKKISL